MSGKRKSTNTEDCCEQKRFKYSEKSLLKAVGEIKEGKMSLNVASRVHNIPKGTLHNKVKNKVPMERKMGPATILTNEEESNVEKWIIDKAKLGFPMHANDVKDSIQKVLIECPRENPFTDNRPGNKWLSLFLRRHPEIVKRNTEAISKTRTSVTKVAWKSAVRRATQLAISINKKNFAKLFQSAFDSARKEVIINSFKTCGLFPLNLNAIDYSKSISVRRTEINKETEESLPTFLDYSATKNVIEYTIKEERLKIFMHHLKRGTYEDGDDKNLFLLWKTCVLNYSSEKSNPTLGMDIMSMPMEIVEDDNYNRDVSHDCVTDVDILYPNDYCDNSQESRKNFFNYNADYDNPIQKDIINDLVYCDIPKDFVQYDPSQGRQSRH